MRRSGSQASPITYTLGCPVTLHHCASMLLRLSPLLSGFCSVPWHHSVSSPRTGWSVSCSPVPPAPAQDPSQAEALCTVDHVVPLVPISWMTHQGSGGQVSTHGHPSRKPQFCLSPEALAFPVHHAEASPTPSLRVSRCARKGVGRLTIFLPAPWRPWLVQTAGSPGFPLCQSASCRKTEEKRAGWRGRPPWLSSPIWTKSTLWSQSRWETGGAWPAIGDGICST